jgi:hypothetical protein
MIIDIMYSEWTGGETIFLPSSEKSVNIFLRVEKFISKIKLRLVERREI